jgi:hypothetical protein
MEAWLCNFGFALLRPLGVTNAPGVLEVRAADLGKILTPFGDLTTSWALLYFS